MKVNLEEVVGEVNDSWRSFVRFLWVSLNEEKTNI